jgi:hypothetical protein
MNYNTKESLADITGNVSYSLITGIILDIVSGLKPMGILTSRAYATAANFVLAAPYGKWRNIVFKATKTTDGSSKKRRYFADLLSFNTFQTLQYASAVTISTLITEGHVNLEKVVRGTAFLMTISPIIGPSMGWYMDKIRKLFKIKSAPERARQDLEKTVEAEK